MASDLSHDWSQFWSAVWLKSDLSKFRGPWGFHVKGDGQVQHHVRMPGDGEAARAIRQAFYRVAGK